MADSHVEVEKASASCSADATKVVQNVAGAPVGHPAKDLGQGPVSSECQALEAELVDADQHRKATLEEVGSNRPADDDILLQENSIKAEEAQKLEFIGDKVTIRKDLLTLMFIEFCTLSAWRKCGPQAMVKRNCCLCHFWINRLVLVIKKFLFLNGDS